MLTRRLFLAGAALAAPAIVRSESLMKLWVPPAQPVWVGIDLAAEPKLYPCEVGFIDRFRIYAGGVWHPVVDDTEFWGVSILSGREHVAKHQAANRRLRALLGRLS